MTPQDEVTPLDEALIRECYELARQSAEQGDHPFGALLLSGGKVVLKATNSVLTGHDVTRHAERMLITAACEKLSPDELTASTLYTSTEPCVMCAGAIYWARVPRVVYGVNATSLARLAQPHEVKFAIPCRDVYERIEPTVDVVGPVLEEEGLAVHRRYWPKILGL